MASSHDTVSMAVFCDFENVALGVRDANYEKFDIKPVLERLLLKGSIVVKKAYCDWDRYKGFKATMHEANFELIEIPHVRQSGKNSADIRLVVDALDLCYTKSHVNTFVIISGDSDFSPLVSKLRENAKQVIGVGVKQSTSDLLIANCDEFIFYDDLVRESRRAEAKRDERKAQPQAKRPPTDESNRRKEEVDARKSKAIEMAVETFDALVSERGDSGKIWASMLKEAITRRKPDFSESYYGFRTFGNLLEEAQTRGLLEFGRDEKSGAYVYRSSGNAAAASAVENVNGNLNEQPELETAAAPLDDEAPAAAAPAPAQNSSEEGGARRESSRRGGRGRKQESSSRRGNQAAADEAVAVGQPYEEPVPAPVLFEPAPFVPVADIASPADALEAAPADAGNERRKSSRSRTGFRTPVVNIAETVGETVAFEPVPAVAAPEAAAEAEVAAADDGGGQREPRRNGRGGRKPAAKKAAAAPAEAPKAVEPAVEIPAAAAVAAEAPAKAGRKPASRSSRPRKQAASE
ncbi:MAG TPA: NYN domain-containing protein [Janthinobacterium sp.]|nr:NYN domain-containing protein [Janthinobacterium sp.]